MDKSRELASEIFEQVGLWVLCVGHGGKCIYGIGWGSYYENDHDTIDVDTKNDYNKAEPT